MFLIHIVRNSYKTKWHYQINRPYVSDNCLKVNNIRFNTEANQNIVMYSSTREIWFSAFVKIHIQCYKESTYLGNILPYITFSEPFLRFL